MSPAFLIFLGALAAILIWAVGSLIVFKRKVKDRTKREQALSERATAYREELKGKIDDIRTRLGREQRGMTESAFLDTIVGRLMTPSRLGWGPIVGDTIVKRFRTREAALNDLCLYPRAGIADMILGIDYDVPTPRMSGQDYTKAPTAPVVKRSKHG